MARAQKKLTKQELREDPLMKTVANAQGWMDIHGRKMAIGVIGIVVIVLAFVMYNKVQNSATDDSLLSMAQARKLLAEGKKDNAISLMEQTYQQFKGTQGGAEALYSLAELRLAENDNQAAADLFDEFIKDYKNQKLLIISAMDGRATALENLDQFLEAAKMYDRVAASDKHGHLIPIALLNAGRCYMKTGNSDMAGKRFQRILDEFEKSKVKTDAEIYLAKLELND